MRYDEINWISTFIIDAVLLFSAVFLRHNEVNWTSILKNLNIYAIDNNNYIY